MTARQAVLEALVAERFGGPVVREWHGSYGLPTDYAEVVRRRAELEEIDTEDEDPR